MARKSHGFLFFFVIVEKNYAKKKNERIVSPVSFRFFSLLAFLFANKGKVSSTEKNVNAGFVKMFVEAVTLLNSMHLYVYLCQPTQNGNNDFVFAFVGTHTHISVSLDK